PGVRSADLSAGAAATDITPPRGCPMAGYYSVRGAEGTHDPLHAKALVLDKDGVKVALVALDLISTTHSHTGPILWGRTQRDELLGGSSQIAKDYIKDLPAKIAAAVKKADA